MRKNFYFLLLVFSMFLLNGIANAQTITSAGVSGEWTVGSTWVGGVVPTSSDNVLIATGDIVSVSDANATCHSISFGGDDSHIDMNADARLTVYGDFTLFSTSHVVFSTGWSGTDAKIVFAGDEEQVLSGWNPDGGSTSFRDVIIDKTGGSLSTDGSGMRLGIQNSLQIISGLFLLKAGDDLEGRWASSGNFTNNNLPDITVDAGGEFDMEDGDGVHHIRSNTGSIPIGKMTVYGVASFRDASTNDISINNIDVEDGGWLVISSGLADSFFPGTITVKSGGTISVSTISDVWDVSTIVDIQSGGTFSTTASSTNIPDNFIDGGIFKYERTSSSQQNVFDRDYNNLEIEAYNEEGKVWDMASDRTVETLTVVDSGQFVLVSETGNDLIVNDSIAVVSGNVCVHDTSDAAIRLGAGAILYESDTSKISGVIYTERVTAQSTNESFGNIGLELNAADASPGSVVVTRTTGETLDIDGRNSIARYFEVVSATNTGLNATLIFHYFESELVIENESILKVFRSDDGISNWVEIEGSSVNTDENTVTVTGLDAISGFYTLIEKMVLITDITVTSEGGATTITTDNGTLQMYAEVLPADATDGTFTWSVNNVTGQATISATGLLTAVSNGTVYAVATANDASDIADSILITLSEQILIPVANITVTGEVGATNITTDGGTLQMNVEVLPANATDKTVKWSVNNLTGEATISTAGLLTAVSDGTVYAVAKANDASGIADSLLITISGQIVLVTDITVTSEGDANSILTNGGTLQIYAEVLPKNATTGTVSWSVNNVTGEATIDLSGLLTAVSNGTVYVVAKANDASDVADSLLITISGQSVGIEDLTKEIYGKIYPNPVSNIATLEINVKENTDLKFLLFTLEGKLVREVSIKKLTNGVNKMVLDVSELPNGNYIYKLNNGMSAFSDQLIIMK